MAITPNFPWENERAYTQCKFTCGHPNCAREVASVTGWGYRNNISGRYEGFIYICPMCHRPTFIDATTSPATQVPGVSFGRVVEFLPPDIQTLYEEIRRATSTNCYTSAVLACRKILMHIAVEKKAPPDQNFITYVEYLVKNHFAPPGSEPWVDKIRKSGNEANHEIKIVNPEDAKELINFLEMLLKFVYEFPGKLSSPKQQ